MKYSDLFQMNYGQREYHSKGHLIPDPEGTPLISSSGQNYGLYGRFDVTPKYHNVISVASTGSVGYAFYHGYSCCIDDNCLVLIPKRIMTVNELIFYAMSITSNRFRFMYGRQVTPARLGVLEAPEVPSWVRGAKVADISRVKRPFFSQNNDLPPVAKWGQFTYSQLFEIKKGKRLTKQNMSPGKTLFIGSSDSNNGLTSTIDRPPLHASNTISVCYNGSVAEAFYQAAPYWASDDVNVLYPKFELNSYRALFLTTLIKREKYRYNYGRKWHLGRMGESVIKLPIDQNNSPDWDLIERYMKSLPYSSII